jgi:hypothetical protein
MKKAIVPLILICSLFGCSKEKSTILTYPKTNLPNTTWQTDLNEKEIYTNLEEYEFIKFDANNGVTLMVGVSLTDANAAITKATYKVNIGANGSNIDSFDVTYAAGNVQTGFTTQNVNQIQFQTFIFNKVN